MQELSLILQDLIKLIEDKLLSKCYEQVTWQGNVVLFARYSLKAQIEFI